jgi:hypothetical protein
MAEEKQLDPPSTHIKHSESPARAKIAFGHEIDADDALQAVQGKHEVGIVGEATNKRILRKVDMVFMPVRIIHEIKLEDFNLSGLSCYV